MQAALSNSGLLYYIRIYNIYKKIFLNPLEVMFQLSRGRTKNIETILRSNEKHYKFSDADIQKLVWCVNKGLDPLRVIEYADRINKGISEINTNDNIELLRIKGPQKNVALALKNEETIMYGGQKIILNDIRNNGDLIDVYVNEDYKFLDVGKRTVVDVGANIGDSAIYFALKGAARVYALEPFSYTYSILERNIRENGFESRIIPINGGYGKDCLVAVNNEAATMGSILVAGENSNTNFINGQKFLENSKTIRVYSLKNLIETFGIEKGAVLKMDCEGCEYSLLTENSQFIEHLV